MSNKLIPDSVDNAIKNLTDAALHGKNLKLIPKMCLLTTFGRTLIHVCVE